MPIKRVKSRYERKLEIDVENLEETLQVECSKNLELNRRVAGFENEQQALTKRFHHRGVVLGAAAKVICLLAGKKIVDESGKEITVPIGLVASLIE